MPMTLNDKLAAVPEQLGEKIYWRGGGNRVESSIFRGQTSRSWIVGGEYEWSQYKLPKKTTVFTTEEEFELFLWASRNQYRIGQRLQYSCSAQQLKKVAELIGYVEEIKP